MITLIIATINRKIELDLFLKSLLCQTYKDFEVIIVDQNQNGLIDDVVKKYEKNIKIKHKKISQKGLSLARNKGIDLAKGDILAFPDDDCWYDQNTLSLVMETFSKYPYLDGLTGRLVNDKKKPIQKNEIRNKEKITYKNIWGGAISVTIFLKKGLIDKIKYFDENIGAGSPYGFGSGEETDYIYRAITQKANIYHFTHILVYHPDLVTNIDEKSIHKAFLYGKGMGYVMKKNNVSVFEVIYYFLRPCIGMILAAVQGSLLLARFRCATVKGRIVGFFSSQAYNASLNIKERNNR